MALSAVNNMLSGYNAYKYGSGLRVAIDKNNDGNWNRAEVENYAKSYEKATGNKIDVDKLFEQYDAEGTGRIDFNAQEQIYKDDALNLKALSGSFAPETSAAEKYSSSVTTSLEDLLSTMSASSKMSLSKMVYKTEQQGNLWSAFGMDSSGLNNLMYGLANYQSYSTLNNSGNNWGSYLGQMMNMVL